MPKRKDGTPNAPKSSKWQHEIMVDQVRIMILNGNNRQQIIGNCSKEFGILEKASDQLIYAAYKIIKTDAESTRESGFEWHVENRKQLISMSIAEKDRTNALKAAADLAKLQGLYPKESLNLNHSGSVEISAEDQVRAIIKSIEGKP